MRTRRLIRAAFTAAALACAGGCASEQEILSSEEFEDGGMSGESTNEALNEEMVEDATLDGER